MKRYEVIVVGAGIIGLSIAFQIARRSPRHRVLVLEKGAAVGEGSTGASSAICRYRYTTDDMVLFARDGIDAYRRWPEFTGLRAPRAVFQNDGVLWMPGQDKAWADTEHARLRRLGIESLVLDDAALAERFPALSPCTLSPDFETGEEHDCQGGGRNLLETAAGWMDPVGAAQDLVEAGRAAGVDIRFRAPVAGVDRRGGRVRGITLADGESLSCGIVVNAAGPWCAQLDAMAGLSTRWTVEPVRIQVLYRDRPEELPGDIPVTADLHSGIYFRTQNRGQQLIVSTILEEDEKEVVANPDDFRRETDEQFELLKLHALHHRLPALPHRGTVRGYCGLYTMNRDDVHPILGPTAIEGYWVACGFSGHGFKLAPAVGSMIARAITGAASDFDTQTPLSTFSIDRAPIDIASKSVLA